MIREATQLEKREWWKVYGLDLRKFAACGGIDGMTHWVADAYSHSGEMTLPFRVCDMIWDEEWEPWPAEEVSCMACIAQSCRPTMMGEIS